MVHTLDSGVGWGWGNLHGNGDGDGEFFVGTGWGWAVLFTVSLSIPDYGWNHTPKQSSSKFSEKTFRLNRIDQKVEYRVWLV